MKHRKSTTAAAIRKLNYQASYPERKLNPTAKEKALEASFSQGFAAARAAAAQLVQEQFDREIGAMQINLRVQNLPHINNL